MLPIINPIYSAKASIKSNTSSLLFSHLSTELSKLFSITSPQMKESEEANSQQLINRISHQYHIVSVLRQKGLTPSQLPAKTETLSRGKIMGKKEKMGIDIASSPSHQNHIHYTSTNRCIFPCRLSCMKVRKAPSRKVYA